MHFSQIPVVVLPAIHAYLDPGTGSIIIQVAIAAVVGGAILLKTFWKKIFHKKSKSEELPSDVPSDLPAEDVSDGDGPR
jgi:nitrogen fixation protein